MNDKKMEEFGALDRIDIAFLENHIHFLIGDINEDTVGECVRWLLYESLNSKPKELTLYVNSTGGDLNQAFALIDTMRISPHPIKTIAIGNVMSAAFLIFASGAKGLRYVTKNTSAMCHQFNDAAEGKYHDMQAAMRESEMCNQRMVNILKDATGLPINKVKSKLLPPSDVYFSATELLDLNIADHVL